MAGAPVPQGAVIVRPEKILFSEPAACALPGRMKTRVFQGNHWLCQVETSVGEVMVIRQNDGVPVPAEGETAVRHERARQPLGAERAGAGGVRHLPGGADGAGVPDQLLRLPVLRRHAGHVHVEELHRDPDRRLLLRDLRAYLRRGGRRHAGLPGAGHGRGLRAVAHGQPVEGAVPDGGAGAALDFGGGAHPGP
ncbi:hypothetical protein G6F62_012770 [Rhizopus arrhizus]|nr:hypothetical protein G6F62_012770 [Rhizopus arrhizus]